MNRHPGHLALLLSPALLLAACGSGQQHTAKVLDHRLEARLAPDIAAGRAAVQQLPDGARVTLLDPRLSSNGPMAPDDQYSDIRANVIEGMMDPSLMQVQVADTSTLPDEQRVTRVRNVEQYFAANGLGSVLRPAQPREAAAMPAGLAITITVQCPQQQDGSGYGDGTSKPVCD